MGSGAGGGEIKLGRAERTRVEREQPRSEAHSAGSESLAARRLSAGRGRET